MYILSFRIQKYGGPVTAGVLNPSIDRDILEATRAVFLIHGYNNNRDVGEERLREFAAELPTIGEKVVIIAVLWPGDSMLGAVSYPVENKDADQTARYLAEFIQKTWKDGQTIDFVAHSLGNRVAFQTTKLLASHYRYNINQICSLAGAVDDTCLSERSVYKSAAEAVVRTVVVSSTQDKTLKMLYPIGDLFSAFIFWKEKNRKALGYKGPLHTRTEQYPKNVKSVKIDPSHEVGHGDYFGDKRSNIAALCVKALAGNADLEYK